MASITIYIDFLSPYTYFAYHRLRNSPAFRSVPITVIPVYLVGIFKATENRSPLVCLPKSAYIMHDTKRTAALHGIPLHPKQPPPGFPINTITTMRAVCAAQELVDRETWLRIIDVMYATFWVDQKPIQDVEVIREVLESVAGAEVAEKVLAGVAGVGAEILTKNTQAVLDQGCFGLPYLIVVDSAGQTDKWWGSDRLPEIEQCLGLRNQSGAL